MSSDEHKDTQLNRDLKAREEAFFTADDSLLAPILKRLITTPVFRILPSGYSANQLTLSGGACALMVPLSLWFASYEIEQGSAFGRLILLGSTLLLIMYAVFDQLDGMQARRLGTSSSFGDFIDHWVDTSIANLTPVPIMIMLGLSNTLIFWMAMAVLLAFWAANWEVRQSNRRLLPKIGGLEAIMTGCVVLTATAIGGIDIWRVALLGIPLTWMIYAITIPWLVVVVVQVARRAGNQRQRLGFEIAGFALTLAPITCWLVIYAPAIEGSALYYFGYVTIGISATLMTGALMRHHWLGIPYRAIHAGFALPGVLVLLLELLAFTEDLQIQLAACIVAILIGCLFYQGVDTFRKSTG